MTREELNALLAEVSEDKNILNASEIDALLREVAEKNSEKQDDGSKNDEEKLMKNNKRP